MKLRGESSSAVGRERAAPVEKAQETSERRIGRSLMLPAAGAGDIPIKSGRGPYAQSLSAELVAIGDHGLRAGRGIGVQIQMVERCNVCDCTKYNNMTRLLSSRVTEVEQSVTTAVLFSTVSKLEERNHVTTTSIDDRQETVSLIGSDKVEGTAVYGADDRKMGTVQRVMIDKISGKVAYAVISFGGVLGLGAEYYPVPWPNLKYDTRLGGYRIGVTEDQLKGAPKYAKSQEWDWADRENDRRVYDYYGTPLWY
jgi:PRC-barrel domain